ncbi:MAG TPA: iron ABC transporter permease [Terriglobales bacterium]|nr:iron ABC transporter permease [Terriglobales bacterium]
MNRLKYPLLFLLPLMTALACLGVGRMVIPFGEVAAALTGRAENAVVTGMRLPRVLLALLVGGGLSAAGTAFQSLFANPLATPDTLGVAAGASFGAVVGLFFGLPLLAVQLLALAAGFSAVFMTISVGRGRQGAVSRATVVLSGLVVSSLFTAFISFFKYIADTESRLPAITYWLMGSLTSASFGRLALGAPFILAGTGLLFTLRWRLNLLPLSEDEARSAGVNLPLLRGLTALSATMITASAVSMCGQVGWVGLLIPHICRMALGGDNRKLIPASVGLGAAFLVVIDTAARSLTPSEIPISVLTAIIGAPFFIALLRKNGGWEL